MYSNFSRIGNFYDIDYSHPCSQQLELAVVASGSNNLVDLVTHQSGTQNHTSTVPFAKNLPFLGQSVHFPGFANGYISYPGAFISTLSTATLAAYIQADTSFRYHGNYPIGIRGSNRIHSAKTRIRKWLYKQPLRPIQEYFYKLIYHILLAHLERRRVEFVVRRLDTAELYYSTIEATLTSAPQTIIGLILVASAVASIFQDILQRL